MKTQLNKIINFLNQKKIEVELEFNEPLTSDKVEKFFNSFYPNVHESIKTFYIQDCNGFNLHWEQGEDWGDIELDSLQTLKEGFEEYKEEKKFLKTNKKLFKGLSKTLQEDAQSIVKSISKSAVSSA